MTRDDLSNWMDNTGALTLKQRQELLEMFDAASAISDIHGAELLQGCSVIRCSHCGCISVQEPGHDYCQTCARSEIHEVERERDEARKELDDYRLRDAALALQETQDRVIAINNYNDVRREREEARRMWNDEANLNLILKTRNAELETEVTRLARTVDRKDEQMAELQEHAQKVERERDEALEVAKVANQQTETALDQRDHAERTISRRDKRIEVADQRNAELEAALRMLVYYDAKADDFRHHTNTWLVGDDITAALKRLGISALSPAPAQPCPILSTTTAPLPGVSDTAQPATAAKARAGVDKCRYGCGLTLNSFEAEKYDGHCSFCPKDPITMPPAPPSPAAREATRSEHVSVLRDAVREGLIADSAREEPDKWGTWVACGKCGPVGAFCNTMPCACDCHATTVISSTHHHVGKGAVWGCTCETEPQRDTVIRWNPDCELHGDAARSKEGK